MSFLFDLYRTARFATRLPLPVLARENDDPVVDADGFAAAFAVCGMLVGLIGGLVAAALTAFGAAPTLAGTLAVAVMVLATGALHEDGLADVADGLGGGQTRERKLEIMRDPRIGSYGVLALILCTGGRALALAALLAIGPVTGLLALVATQTLSRALAMAAASALPHARPDGASVRLGRPSGMAAMRTLAIAVAIAALALSPAASVGGTILCLVLLIAAMGAAAALLASLANSQIGGQSGDVLGAIQQAADLAGLVILSISLPWML